MSHTALLYSWLDPSRRQIRLLRLDKPGTQDHGRITGELSTYSMDSAPIFDALSYAWGVDVVAEPIIVNAEAVFVTRNLYQGLQNFRQGDHAEYIWLDAICINQRNFAERSHQVTLMRDLFSMARVVHVWLGPSTPSTERTLYVLDRAGRRLSPDFEDADLLPAEINSVSTEAFQSIFTNPWWNRLWVVQEVVLAKEPIAHFGSDLSIHFSRLLMGILACFRLRDQSSAETTLPWYMMQLALKFSAPMTAKTSERPHMKLIPDILAAVRDSKVSVRHDRIYGLLGLLPVQLAIEPDYGRRLEHVFTEFTLRVIWHERSLDVLALGGLHGPSDLILPSWVPSYGHPAPYLFRGTSGFDASKALASHPQLGFPNDVAKYAGSGVLSVWAHELGTISFAISAVPEELSTTLAENKEFRGEAWYDEMINDDLTLRYSSPDR
ncbi:Heterokaryon incompatibility protein 6, OR allele [Pseudocercospora fuligena]|uniref:Heterokaryon incompatibility protein 6, OR allele n=1 Tax=Pseudocercospora fuligena TaxID=685502 RepID=A0A8H6RL13_9PEZI|nr:Heterokaryon incompatibility protein 6, OR allele [Pseudocercospora fuligena]